MSFELNGVVKYFLQNNNYYIVGDNTTNIANGITNKGYSGEIIIPEKIKNKEIREIGQYAFYECASITRVTIFAKLIRINYKAFHYCENITYINIPRTTTFIGVDALCVSSNGISSVPLTVEFNKGRTQNIFLDSWSFSYRNVVSIIYPSSLEPSCDSWGQFYGVTKATICAHSLFSFCNKFTTTKDMSQCPGSFFMISRKRKIRNSTIIISLSILILILPFICIKPKNAKSE